jgi:hypothetical protein
MPYIGGMNTDTPCTPADRQAIVDAAVMRRDYLLWLAARLGEPTYSSMLPIGRADIRAAVVIELVQLAGGPQ